MTVSPTALVLSISIGLPLVLLAIGVFYHARVIRRQAFDQPLDDHVGALATAQSEELLRAFQGAMLQIKDDLAEQRASLSSMLGDGVRGATPELAARSATAAHSVALNDARPGTADLSAAVRQLVAEGLSDRAIARRLHVGLEEVRMARARGGRAG